MKEDAKGELVFNGNEANPDDPPPSANEVAAPPFSAATILAAFPPLIASQHPSTKKTMEFAHRFATAFWRTVQLLLSIRLYALAIKTMS
ncbi:hypothetical protein [Comamonas odontotermitis]|uniref:hypothetical protein n=1 Tax=Comamonas odontotermitis TaxID=379895 RepID=UPI001CC531E8|nr:hypothetical protein [Comamonas odontotermitis]UBB16045.1 hypothetical protein LAD35_14565 [Comamonas odontotermitis]